jgi:uncharacterized protein
MRGRYGHTNEGLVRFRSCNGLVYHSEPFAEATEASGQVKLTLWIALDVPDTDLKADLYEILPNGDSVVLS